MQTKRKNTLLILSILTYITSLFFIGYFDKGNHRGTHGFTLVLFGGISCISSGGASLVWLANPVLWVAWITSKKIKLSLNLSIASLIIALSFLCFDTIEDPDYSGTDGIPTSQDVVITGYGIGYILWVFSSLILMCRNLLESEKVNTSINLSTYIDNFIKETFPPRDENRS